MSELRSEKVQVMVSAIDLERIKQAAKAAHMSLSTFFMAAALDKIGACKHETWLPFSTGSQRMVEGEYYDDREDYEICAECGARKE